MAQAQDGSSRLPVPWKGSCSSSVWGALGVEAARGFGTLLLGRWERQLDSVQRYSQQDVLLDERWVMRTSKD